MQRAALWCTLVFRTHRGSGGYRALLKQFYKLHLKAALPISAHGLHMQQMCVKSSSCTRFCKPDEGPIKSPIFTLFCSPLFVEKSIYFNKIHPFSHWLPLLSVHCLVLRASFLLLKMMLIRVCGLGKKNNELHVLVEPIEAVHWVFFDMTFHLNHSFCKNIHCVAVSPNEIKWITCACITTFLIFLLTQYVCEREVMEYYKHCCNINTLKKYILIQFWSSGLSFLYHFWVLRSQHNSLGFNL